MTLTHRLKPLALAGLIAKGIVYCLLGVLTFMAAFHISGRSAETADKKGVFVFIYDQKGGRTLLLIVAIGLICFCIWRVIQSFADTEGLGRKMKGIGRRILYLFSALVYGFISFQIIRILVSNDFGSGDSFQVGASELLSRPFGQWLVAIAAVFLAAVGIFQVYYGLSEKYRKHVEKMEDSRGKRPMLIAGKIGYVSRGIVWLLIGWLFFRAAFTADSAEAGDTSKAFSFLQDASYGSYLLAAVSIGLFCYGTFSFIRARYGNFNSK